MKHEVTTHNTKKLLADTLKKIMRSKPFSKITVSEIIQECGVNRKTFYYHFQDIYDLLKWVFDEEAIQVVRHFDLLEDYEAAIRFVMDYIRENDYIISCTHDSIGREEMKRFFYMDFIEIITSVINEAETQAHISIEPEFKAYAAKFYTEALAGMLIDWAKNNRKENPEQIVRFLTYLVSAAVESMQTQMNHPQNNKRPFG